MPPSIRWTPLGGGPCRVRHRGHDGGRVVLGDEGVELGDGRGISTLPGEVLEVGVLQERGRSAHGLPDLRGCSHIT